MSIVIERIGEETSELRRLIGELDAVLGANYQPHQRHGLSLVQLFEPHVRFYMARIGGEAVGCGGVALFADYAEVKRMYTRPAARRNGVGRALLQHIEEAARAAGAPVLRLETGTLQSSAIALYEHAGFRRCGAFGPYAVMPAEQVETSLFYEKALR